MGGRGWGGKGSSLTVEQLQSMGVGRGEGPGPTLAPPPLYPKLENPPLPLNVFKFAVYDLINYNIICIVIFRRWMLPWITC